MLWYLLCYIFYSFYLLQPYEPFELPDFERTKLEPLERTAKESVERVNDEPDMPPGKYTWEKTPSAKPKPDDKSLVIPKVKVSVILFILRNYADRSNL